MLKKNDVKLIKKGLKIKKKYLSVKRADKYVFFIKILVNGARNEIIKKAIRGYQPCTTS